MNEQCGRGVTPENNAVVPIMRAMGPNIFYEDQNERFFQAIGSPPPPKEGDYFAQESFNSSNRDVVQMRADLRRCRMGKRMGRDDPPHSNFGLRNASGSQMRTF